MSAKVNEFDFPCVSVVTSKAKFWDVTAMVASPRYGTLKHEKKKTSAYSTVVLISSYLDTCMNTSLKFSSYLNTVLEPSLLKYGQVPTSIQYHTYEYCLCHTMSVLSVVTCRA